MLNIGLLAPGAGEYYIGEVASSAEDYYTGRGESAGRWVGSLAAEINLVGEVDPDQFRAVLAGRDPGSGEQLVHRKAPRPAESLTVDADQSFDVLQAASALGVSGQYVRRLLQDGDRYTTDLAAAGDATVAPPKHYLHGERHRTKGEFGPVPWSVTGAELRRRRRRVWRSGPRLLIRTGPVRHRRSCVSPRMTARVVRWRRG